MSRKIWLILILILSHAAVAALTFTITRSLIQQTSITQPRQTNGVGTITATTESRLERFVKDMSPYARARDAAILGELLLTLQVFEQMEEPDRRLIIGLKPDDVTIHQLVEILSVQSFLGSYSGPAKVDALAFTSEQYRPLLKSLVGDTNLAPERVITVRKQIQQLADGFSKLRNKAFTLPYTDIDDRLHFLEMLRDMASEQYSDAKIMVEPVLPIFNDREGRLLSSLEKWLNSTHAQKALPVEQFEPLYRDGKFHVLSPPLKFYLNRIKDRIGEEHRRARESQEAATEQLSRVYSDIETFFESVARLSSPE